MTTSRWRKAFSRPGRTRAPRIRSVRVGGRTVQTRGLQGSFWGDFYPNAMTIGWGAFLGYSALVFALTNAIFAGLYLLGDDPIANVSGDHPLMLFFFSIETLATVGYGDMHPQSLFGHTVASVEMFAGLFQSALLTGLIFARFSRPRARFVFADLVTIGVHEGKPTLIVRVANARQNMISNATAKLWLIRRRTNLEGVDYRGFEPLALEKSENPVFMLSWSLFHTIDAGSPLAGMSLEEMKAVELSLLLALTGLDEVTAQQVHGRQAYEPDQFRWKHRYADILVRDAEGRTFVDYTHFQDVIAIDGAD